MSAVMDQLQHGLERGPRRPLVATILLAGMVALVTFGMLARQAGPSRLVVHGAAVTDEASILSAVGPELEHGLFSVSLTAIETGLEALPWVARADVSRRFPGTVVATLTEREPVARWGENQLLSDHGITFVGNGNLTEGQAALPRLSGPDASAAEVLATYQILAPAFANLGETLVALEIDDRGAWTARLADGVEIRLGRHDVETRVATFVGPALTALADDWARVAYVDLRYSNGFAVGWRAGMEPGTDGNPNSPTAQEG